MRDYLKALDADSPARRGDARYLSPTDPAAAWNTKEGRGKFGYFNNYLVDTVHAVIVDVEATPARIAQEIIATKAMLGRVEEKHGIRPERLAPDKAYGTGPFLGWLSERKIVPHIPVLDRQHQTDGLLPREAFTFDPTKNHYICPQGKFLKHRTAREEKRSALARAFRLCCTGIISAFTFRIFPFRSGSNQYSGNSNPITERYVAVQFTVRFDHPAARTRRVSAKPFPPPGRSNL